MSQLPGKNRSTLHDVALRAGVSASTASSVLSGDYRRRRISEETQLRVRDAAQDLSYTPNLLHRSIRRGRTQVISVFNAFRRRDRNDLYLDRLFGAVEEACGELGYNVLIHTNYNQSPQQTYEFLNGGFSDGLVLFGSTEDDPLLPLLKESALPTVLVAPRHPHPEFVSVVDDEAMGMRLAAEALLAHGHRRIAVVTIRSDPTGRGGRLRAELAKQGVPFDDRNHIVFDGDPQETARQLLALDPRPSALFVWHDGNAYRILDALETMGVSVPRDLSIVGYDGIVWPCKSSHVISCVDVPLDEVALVGVSLLHQLISGDQSILNQIIPVRFNLGTTLGPPPSSSPTKESHHASQSIHPL